MVVMGMQISYGFEQSRVRRLESCTLTSLVTTGGKNCKNDLKFL